jgi:asparagine synthase (glutamine-hydrolysing)
MLLYHRAGQDAAVVEKLLKELSDLNSVSRGMLLPDGEAGPLDDVKRLLGFVPSWMETFSSRAVKLREVLSDSYLAAVGRRQGYRSLLGEIDVRRQLTGREPVNQSLYLWSKTALPNYVLTFLGDRMEMGHSIEGRVPFLDHHVVEVIRSQPVSQKIRGMTEKYVLREAARDVITDTIYRRQKHPFLAPPATLNPQGRLNAFVQDTLRGPTLASMPFFDRKKVVGLLDRIDDMDDGGRVANDQTLMLITSACVLQERFKLAA